MVFEVSWGETFILIGAATAIIGRKDLPRASRFLGAKMGRVVGFLQGARLRADQFASSNELTALQNELRSGLRELDTVKGELAIAASSRGLVGRGLGSTVGLGSGNGEQRSVNARSSSPHPTKAQGSIEGLSGHDYLDAARGQAENLSPPRPSHSHHAFNRSPLSPKKNGSNRELGLNQELNARRRVENTEVIYYRI